MSHPEKAIVDDKALDECANSILMLQNTEIYSQRVYNLRRRQRESGVEFVNLRAEQKGLLPVNFMHHVSKVVEGKMSFYRVRICRTCSGLPTLIELGSFADVESALLVNDAHEITHGRTKQLHLLVKGDITYFNWLSVRCRGATEDIPLQQVLGARLLKSSKRKAAQSDDEEKTVRSARKNVLHHSEVESDPRVASSMSSSISMLLTAAIPMSGSGSGSGMLSGLELLQPSSQQQQQQQLQQSLARPPARYQEDFNLLTMSNSINSSYSNSSAAVLNSGFIGLPSSSQAVQGGGGGGVVYSAVIGHEEKRAARRSSASARGYSNSNIRLNFMSSQGFESIWGMVGTAESMRDLIGVLFLCLDEKVLLSTAPLQVGVDMSALTNIIRYSNTPASAIHSLLASLICGSSYIVFPLFTRIKTVIPRDTAPLSSDVRAALLAACREINQSNTIGYEKSYQLLWLINNASAYFDWNLRLCVFDGNVYDDPTLLESKIHGIFSLLESRNGFLAKFLHDINRVVAQYEGDHNSDQYSTLLDVQKNTITTMINMQVNMLSSSMIIYNVCCDPIALMSCIRTCNNFLPTIVEYIVDPSILHIYLERLLSAQNILFLTEKLNLNYAQNDQINLKTVLIDTLSTLGSQLIKIVRVCFHRFSKTIKGPALLAFYETIFSSYCAIFYLSILLHKEKPDFLEINGFTMEILVKLIQGAISFIHDYVKKLNCVVVYTQTILSLINFIEISEYIRFRHHPADYQYPVQIGDIRGKSQMLLECISGRYLLAQLLIDQNSSENNKVNEPC